MAILERMTNGIEDGDDMQDLLAVFMALSAVCCMELNIEGMTIDCPNGAIHRFEMIKNKEEAFKWQ